MQRVTQRRNLLAYHSVLYTNSRYDVLHRTKFKQRCFDVQTLTALRDFTSWKKYSVFEWEELPNEGFEMCSSGCEG